MLQLAEPEPGATDPRITRITPIECGADVQVLGSHRLSSAYCLPGPPRRHRLPYTEAGVDRVKVRPSTWYSASAKTATPPEAGTVTSAA